MTFLLINDTPPPEDEPHTRFGGRPLLPAGSAIAWPRCETCDGSMQFLGQLRLEAESKSPERLLLLFMCQNDPGMCDEWEADGGGNRVISATVEDLEPMEFPAEGEVSRGKVHGARIEEVDEDEYDAARAAWGDAVGQHQRDVLGQLGGEPAWMQTDETPECDSCGEEMYFVAQLEEGPDHRTAMNFGGGCAYVFECDCGAQSAKMLWQQ
jgi:hypothetical protein